MRRFPLLVAAAIALAGCGATGSDRSGRDVTLAIGGTPGAAARRASTSPSQRGFDEAEGVTLHPKPVARPGARARLRQVGAGRAGHPRARARASARRGPRRRARASSRGRSPRCGPTRLRAATQRTPGAPEYPELLLVAPRATITDDRASVRGAVAALQRGYGEAYVDPDAATQALVTAVPRPAHADRVGGPRSPRPRLPGHAADVRRARPGAPARVGGVGAAHRARQAAAAARAFDGRFVKAAELCGPSAPRAATG